MGAVFAASCLPSMADYSWEARDLATLLYPTYTRTSIDRMSLPAALQFLSSFATLAVVITLCLKFFLDYRAFKALGSGGTPSTIVGFLQVQILGFFAMSNRFELPDTSTQHCQSGLQPDTAFLSHNLPQRTGPRPVTKGIAPQRQLTQRITGEIYTILLAGLTSIPADKTTTLSTSHIEGHSPALLQARCAIYTPSMARCMWFSGARMRGLCWRGDGGRGILWRGAGGLNALCLRGWCWFMRRGRWGRWVLFWGLWGLRCGGGVRPRGEGMP